MAILAENRASMVSRGVNKSGNGVESDENVEDGRTVETQEIIGIGLIQYGSQVRSMCEGSS
jgi:hypothetical protein